jgi:pimeloyl-ACP methyl ester carboxylesterase
MLTLAGLAVGASLSGPSGGSAEPAQNPPPPWTSQGFVRRPGSVIHYVAVGEGEPVVLLHKLGGQVADWRGVAPLLAAHGRKVIAIDLPGHGESTVLGPPPEVITVAETTATIRAVLQTLGVRGAAVVGNSLGGVVGIMLAALWPDEVPKLGLISVSLIPAMTLQAVRQQDVDRRAEFDAHGAPLPRTAADVAQIGYRDPRVLVEDNESRAKAGVWMRPQERGVGLAGVTDYLPRIRAPTLLILGDIGRYLKYEAVARAQIHTIEVVHVPGSGAFVQQERPVEAAQAINHFLG